MIRKNYLRESRDSYGLSDIITKLTYLANMIEANYGGTSTEVDDLFDTIGELQDLRSSLSKQAQIFSDKLL